MATQQYELSPKQALYLEMLDCAAPFIRNGLSNLKSTRMTRLTFIPRKEVEPYYEVSELVHSMTMLIQNPEFDQADLWFLNHHARKFYEKGDVEGNMPYTRLIGLIHSLISLMPKNLRYHLEWDGPLIGAEHS
jgi:hypothetical protein